ncbi:MAG: O-succinylbenzoate--CoA ligase [Sulfobacillus benefaciens]|uniref:O-succinylbenzoate--CoA ligase n=1 Tax=Sulfobacillus benefaciens TaxID=453960 RepID=A0A2T2XKY8_9FIRM|nr:MAG: O-succinylbenzoate--CoA ligase [Sulfobacillus benefaciens]
MLLDLLEERANALGHHHFLIDPEQPNCSTSYKDFHQGVVQYGEQLRKKGVREGDRVGLPVRSAMGFIPAWFALLSLNAVPVPIAGDSPWAEATSAFTQVGARWYLAQDQGQWQLKPWTAVAMTPGSREQRYPGGGVVLWTSGTSGEPKPVAIKTSALLHTAEQVSGVHGLMTEDVGYSPLPLFHINAEVVAVLASFLAGSTVVIPRRFRRSLFWDHIQKYKATWINAVPSILAIVAQDATEPEDIRRVRLIRSASMALPSVVREKWLHRWGLEITETYGLSEAASQVAANGVQDNRVGSVGKPRGIQLRVCDDNGAVLPPGKTGVIEIKGPSVIDPHWGANKWAQEKMHDGWYGTGDVGSIDQDGFVFLKGRQREVINRGGEKVFPREVEEVIRRIPGIVDCTVVGSPHPILGEEVVACVVAETGESTAVLANRVKKFAAEMLAGHKVPSQVITVSTLPTGSTGKVKRRILTQQIAQSEVLS